MTRDAAQIGARLGRATATLGRLSCAAALALGGCGKPVSPSESCTVKGIDVSRHQGNIDWVKVADAGIRFVWIKATEGGDYLDPKFRRNWLLSRAAGLRRGAYHFVYWCRPAKEQAAWFVANVPADPDALPPVLDVEWNPNSRSCPNSVSREKGAADIKVILHAMQRAYGVRPMIYAPSDIYEDLLKGSFEDYPLWARSLHGPPDGQYGERPWRVWQYSETGSVPGIVGNVDLNCADESIKG